MKMVLIQEIFRFSPIHSLIIIVFINKERIHKRSTEVSIQPFRSDAELIKYATWFLRNRVTVFRKDTGICMTRIKGHHAYFPALITCIAFADLLSGLYAGTIENHGLRHLKDYVAKFFKKSSDYIHIDILYLMFRHKIAHIAYPYLIFDT